MKKFLPLFILIFGIVFVLGVLALTLSGANGNGKNSEETSSKESMPLSERPYVSLSPSTDGHWLELNVRKISSNLSSLDYELIYELPDGRTQGVPGSVKLNGDLSVERDLLLGSESSGRYKYDEGVSDGTLTVRFRDKGGKQLVKFSTKFSLLNSTKELVSVDGKFIYVLDKSPGKEYFVVMETFGFPGEAKGEVTAGPYGVFKAEASVKTSRGVLSPTTKAFPGTIKMDGASIYKASEGGWNLLSEGKSSDTGIFTGVSE